MTVPVQVPIEELCEIMESAGVRAIMGQERKHKVTVDYIKRRDPIVFAREDDDDELQLLPEKPRTLVFVLEEQMFGGVTYAAITCEGRIVLSPFVWKSYAHLATMRLVVKTPES